MDATQESNLPDSRLYSGAERARYALPYRALPRARRLRRDWPLAIVLAAVAFDATFSIAATHAHTPAGVTETAAIRDMVAAVPFLAAVLAALAILRPWPAFLAILLLTPLWDAAQISWYTDDFQVIMQTVFVVALGVGCLVSRGRRRTAERGAVARESGTRTRSRGSFGTFPLVRSSHRPCETGRGHAIWESMPELPDIAAYMAALEPRVMGLPLEGVRLVSPFLLRTTTPALSEAAGRTVRELRRVGKRIAIGLDGDLWLVLHLMIAGRLHWKPAHAALNGPGR